MNRLIVLCTLPIWIVFLICVALIIYLCDGRPLFFRQERAGLCNKSFVLFKFRTMSPDAKFEQEFDPSRITKLGNILRRTSLDELPQLINVLMGDMNLIGPRPLYKEYYDDYTPLQRQRLNIKPGITGLSQVIVRNDAGWQRKLALDIIYVRRKNICMDVYIVCLTIVRILRPKGIIGTGNIRKV